MSVTLRSLIADAEKNVRHKEREEWQASVREAEKQTNHVINTVNAKHNEQQRLHDAVMEQMKGEFACEVSRIQAEYKKQIEENDAYLDSRKKGLDDRESAIVKDLTEALQQAWADRDQFADEVDRLQQKLEDREAQVANRSRILKQLLE